MALKRNILIVDDESAILDFLKDGLSMYQDRLNVFTAAGVEEAIGIVDSHRIDLIATDIRMPGMDGFDLISRSRKKNPDTRFIVMTGYSCEEYFQRSKSVGVIDYIRKPFDFEEFIEYSSNSYAATLLTLATAVTPEGRWQLSVSRLLRCLAIAASAANQSR